MISLEKLKIAQEFGQFCLNDCCSKWNKSPNMVTLLESLYYNIITFSVDHLPILATSFVRPTSTSIAGSEQ